MSVFDVLAGVGMLVVGLTTLYAVVKYAVVFVKEFVDTRDLEHLIIAGGLIGLAFFIVAIFGYTIVEVVK